MWTMGLFRWKKAGAILHPDTTTTAAVPATAHPVDVFFGDERLAQAHASLLQGNWGEAEALMHERGGCSRSMRVLSGADVPMETIELWHEATPTARTTAILANALLQYSRAITEDQDVARGAAIRSEALLQKSIQLDPTSPEPWALLIETGIVLGLDRIGTKKLFDQAHLRAPFHAAAVRARVHADAPQAGGSTIGLREFSRWLVNEAPAQSPALGAVVEAQFAIALDLAEAEGLSPMRLMNSTDNIRQAQDALEKLLDGIDGRAPIDLVEPLNRLLFWVSPTNPRSADLNRRGFAALDDRVSAEPWGTVGPNQGQPVAAFQKTRLHRLRMCDQVSDLYAAQSGDELSPMHAHLTPTAQRIVETQARLERGAAG